MSNEFENTEFRKAARAAGVSGRYQGGDEAIRVCSRDFHERISRREREDMSYGEMVSWAQDWWQENSHRCN